MRLTFANVLFFVYICVLLSYACLPSRILSESMLDDASNFYFIISSILVARRYSVLYVLT